MASPEPALEKLLQVALPDAAGFFERARRDLQGVPGVGFRALFASVPRRLGAAAHGAVAVPSEIVAARPHWNVTDYARLWLVLSALPNVAPAEQSSWALGLFEGGEIGEQVSLLRVLGALPDAGRFVETGLQACRHNSLDVFEAIVCENPFLAEHFPALGFNQAIMKAIFNGVALARVEGLERRITPELSRMAAGYASERRAAGRPVPKDADFLIEYGAKGA